MKIILKPYICKPDSSVTIKLVRTSLLYQSCIICSIEDDIDTWSTNEDYNNPFLPKLNKLIQKLQGNSWSHYIPICPECMENCSDDHMYGESIDRWLVENIERKL